MLRFDPFSDLDSMTRGLLTSQTGSIRTPRFMPMDLCKIDDHYVLTADLPGVDPGFGRHRRRQRHADHLRAPHRPLRGLGPVARQRALLRHLPPAAVARRRHRHRGDLGHLRERRTHRDDSAGRTGEAAQDRDRARRRRSPSRRPPSTPTESDAGGGVASTGRPQVGAHRRPLDVEDRIDDGVAPRPVGQQLVAAQYPVALGAEPLDGGAAGRVEEVRAEFHCHTVQLHRRRASSISSLHSVFTPVRRTAARTRCTPISRRRLGPSMLQIARRSDHASPSSPRTTNVQTRLGCGTAEPRTHFAGGVRRRGAGEPQRARRPPTAAAISGDVVRRQRFERHPAVPGQRHRLDEAHRRLRPTTPPPWRAPTARWPATVIAAATIQAVAGGHRGVHVQPEVPADQCRHDHRDRQCRRRSHLRRQLPCGHRGGHDQHRRPAARSAARPRSPVGGTRDGAELAADRVGPSPPSARRQPGQPRTDGQHQRAQRNQPSGTQSSHATQVIGSTLPYAWAAP